MEAWGWAWATGSARLDLHDKPRPRSGPITQSQDQSNTNTTCMGGFWDLEFLAWGHQGACPCFCAGAIADLLVGARLCGHMQDTPRGGDGSTRYITIHINTYSGTSYLQNSSAHALGIDQ
jgi:hypothetical protein